ncbi:GPCR fungal pheromone mating factor, partial [Mycena haematopus]
MALTVILFPIFALVGLVVQLVPLYWQFEPWNVGTLWYIFWVSLSCFAGYFNAVVWEGNTVNSAPAWCEISIRITMAVSVGLPAASLCINRRLYEIARAPLTDVGSKTENRRTIIIDSLISGLFPLLYIPLQLVAERHRFNILEDVGCVVDLYDSLPTYFISYSAPAILSFGSFVYCILSIYAMSASRANITEVLSRHQHLTPSRFLRLAGLALATLFLSAPLALLGIAANATAAGFATQVSGDAALFDFSVIAEIPRSVWASSQTNLIAVELTRWIAPVCALLFFSFFGLAEEAREHY